MFRNVLVLAVAAVVASSVMAIAEDVDSKPVVETAVFAEMLVALEEPSLPERLKRYSPPETYRFILRRSFHPLVCVRVDIIRDLAVVTTKATDGVGGYVTGELLLDRTRQLSGAEQRDLLAAVDRVKFWTLESEEKGRVGLDGATWVIEGARQPNSFQASMGGEYHHLLRWSPEEGPVRELGLLLLRIAELDIRVY